MMNRRTTLAIAAGMLGYFAVGFVQGFIGEWRRQRRVAKETAVDLGNRSAEIGERMERAMHEELSAKVDTEWT